MTRAALASGVLFLGYRMAALALRNITTGWLNVARLNHAGGAKRREAIPTGCGCAVWMDGETQNAT